MRLNKYPQKPHPPEPPRKEAEAVRGKGHQAMHPHGRRAAGTACKGAGPLNGPCKGLEGVARMKLQRYVHTSEINPGATLAIG